MARELISIVVPVLNARDTLPTCVEALAQQTHQPDVIYIVDNGSTDGTRDALATPPLLQPLVRSLPAAKLHWIESADHGYRVPKRVRPDGSSVFDEMARETRAFVAVR